MSDIRVPSEQFFQYHRRYWQLYLVYCVALGAGTLVAVLIPGQQPLIVVVPALVVAGLLVIYRFVVRRRDAKTHDEQLKRIERDEWVIQSRSRARRDALLTVIIAQGPLMLFMGGVPDKPSVAGMGMMTVALGAGVYTASLLRRIKPRDDE
jgi:uncharacterized membrane protein YfcA